MDAANRFKGSLADFRKRRNWTQEELAERTGLTRETVAAWEQGRALGEAVRKLVAVADALGVSLDDLCGRTAPKAPEHAIAESVIALLGDRLNKMIIETVSRTVADAPFRPVDWSDPARRKSSIVPFVGGDPSTAPPRKPRRGAAS